MHLLSCIKNTKNNTGSLSQISAQKWVDMCGGIASIY